MRGGESETKRSDGGGVGARNFLGKKNESDGEGSSKTYVISQKRGNETTKRLGMVGGNAREETLLPGGIILILEGPRGVRS